jgi:hypothetical protein
MHISTKIRASISAIAVVAALSIATTGVASAAISVNEPGDSLQTTTGKPASAQHTTRSVLTDSQPIAPAGSPNVAKDGAATGDGPADDEECESYGYQINTDLDLAEGSLDMGDVAGYITNLRAAIEAEDEGSDRGCFFIDEPADVD